MCQFRCGASFTRLALCLYTRINVRDRVQCNDFCRIARGVASWYSFSFHMFESTSAVIVVLFLLSCLSQQVRSWWFLLGFGGSHRQVIFGETSHTYETPNERTSWASVSNTYLARRFSWFRLSNRARDDFAYTTHDDTSIKIHSRNIHCYTLGIA